MSLRLRSVGIGYDWRRPRRRLTGFGASIRPRPSIVTHAADSPFLRRVVVALCIFGFFFLIKESELPIRDPVLRWGGAVLSVDYDFREALDRARAVPVLGRWVQGMEGRLIPGRAPDSQGGASSGRKGTAGMKRAMSWPVEGSIVAGFGWAPEPGTNREVFHEGVDIEAPEGTLVKAALDGRIVEIKESRIFGNAVLIDHGDGVATFYAHCRDVWVRRLQEVRQGDPIASVGKTGQARSPHLHFEVRVDGVPEDPCTWIGAGERI